MDFGILCAFLSWGEFEFELPGPSPNADSQASLKDPLQWPHHPFQT